ncbi:MAG: hypothetical protein JWR35_3796 [Marmoricola sp.]|nr:hypothetical protein [Marmoricola sp.]
MRRRTKGSRDPETLRGHSSNGCFQVTVRGQGHRGGRPRDSRAEDVGRDATSGAQGNGTAWRTTFGKGSSLQRLRRRFDAVDKTKGGIAALMLGQATARQGVEIFPAVGNFLFAIYMIMNVVCRMRIMDGVQELQLHILVACALSNITPQRI